MREFEFQIRRPEAGESLLRLLDRADRGLLNVRVEQRVDEQRDR